MAAHFVLDITHGDGDRIGFLPAHDRPAARRDPYRVCGKPCCCRGLAFHGNHHDFSAAQWHLSGASYERAADNAVAYVVHGPVPGNDSMLGPGSMDSNEITRSGADGGYDGRSTDASILVVLLLVGGAWHLGADCDAGCLFSDGGKAHRMNLDVLAHLREESARPAARQT